MAASHFLTGKISVVQVGFLTAIAVLMSMAGEQANSSPPGVAHSAHLPVFTDITRQAGLTQKIINGIERSCKSGFDSRPAH